MWTAGALAAVAALLLTAGCGGTAPRDDTDGSADGSLDGATDPDASAAPVVEGALEPEWVVPVEELNTWVRWRTPEALVIGDWFDLRAVSPDTGEELWRLRDPEGAIRVCTISAEAGPNGIAGIVFEATDGTRPSGCSLVAAVDLATGELLWTADHSATVAYPSETADVSVGERVLTVSLACGETYRHDAARGTELSHPVTPDDACKHRAAHSGRHLVVQDMPDGVANELRLHDVETEALLWSAPLERGTRLLGVVTDDPLILDIELDGVRAYRVYDEDGRPVRTVGEPISGTNGIGMGPAPMPGQPEQVFGDGVMLAGYEGKMTVGAYDLATGELLHTRPMVNGRALGIRDGMELSVALVVDPAVSRFKIAELRSWDIREGTEPEVLGRVAPLPASDAAGDRGDLMYPAGWDGEWFYVLHKHLGEGSQLAAYQVPG
jgi:hypothetical protein